SSEYRGTVSQRHDLYVRAVGDSHCGAHVVGRLCLGEPGRPGQTEKHRERADRAIQEFCHQSMGWGGGKDLSSASRIADQLPSLYPSDDVDRLLDATYLRPRRRLIPLCRILLARGYRE